MAKPTAQQCHAMTTHFMNVYSNKFARQAVVNRNKARWGFESILMDYSTKETKELIDYYIDTFENPRLEWFLFNYDKVVTHKNEKMEEARLSRIRREETAKRMERWRNR